MPQQDFTRANLLESGRRLLPEAVREQRVRTNIDSRFSLSTDRCLRGATPPRAGR